MNQVMDSQSRFKSELQGTITELHQKIERLNSKMESLQSNEPRARDEEQDAKRYWCIYLTHTQAHANPSITFLMKFSEVTVLKPVMIPAQSELSI